MRRPFCTGVAHPARVNGCASLSAKVCHVELQHQLDKFDAQLDLDMYDIVKADGH
jgi:hypothetical protein